MHEDDILDWTSKPIHQSSPPLRWVANLFGEISSWAMLRLAFLDEDENFGPKYKIYSAMYKSTWPLYQKYGTFYEIEWNEEDYA